MVSCFKEASFSYHEDLCGLLCGVFQTPERYIWLFLTSYLQVLVRLGRFGLLLCEAQAEAERSGAQQMPRTRSSGGAILHVVQILTMSGCKPCIYLHGGLHMYNIWFTYSFMACQGYFWPNLTPLWHYILQSCILCVSS